MASQARDIKGYYKMLGLEPNATTTDISKAFFQKQAEFHPASVSRQRMRRCKEFMEMSEEKKKAIGEQLDEQATKINEAYNVLSNATRRRQYDNETGEFVSVKPRRQQFDNKTDGSFQKIFSALFTFSPKVEKTCPAIEIVIFLIDIYKLFNN